jgi:drug/metabolite transporter (DMT)-like permease
MTQPRMGPIEWACLIALSFLWGGTFLFAKIALVEVPPLTVVLSRLILAAMVLHVAMRAIGIDAGATRPGWRDFMILGLINNIIPFCLIFWGQTEISVGLASILNATTPLFSVIVAHFLTRDETLTRLRAIGVAAGLFGVAAMIGLDALSSLGTSIVHQLAVLAAALSYGFAGVFSRRFKGAPAMTIATGQLTASAVMLAPLTLLVDQPWTLPMPSHPVIFSLLALGVFSTALAYFLYFRILTASGATNAALVTFLIPVSALALGVLFLGESVGGPQLFGMVLIALGLSLIDGRLWRWRRQKSRSA